MSEPVSYSPQLAWDAEYSHDWIGRVFCPAVIAHQARREREFRKKSSVVTPDSAMFSSACMPFAGASLRLVTLAELRGLVTSLQQHFHGYGSDVPVRADSYRSTLSAVLRLLRAVKHRDEHYIREKLQLHSGSVEEGIENLLKDLKSIITSFELDLALRCLYAMVHDVESTSTSELDWIAACLKPVWDRVREDRICRTYK
jgi:hypothetical protein